jgi:hypothetical protein
MGAVAMVTKVQKMLNSLQTADPFETWHKNRSSLKVVLFVFKIFKMAAQEIIRVQFLTLSCLEYLVTNFSQIGGFLYFGGHFGFKMFGGHL